MSSLQYTPLKDIKAIHSDLRNGFQTGKLKSIPYRKYQLLQLAYLIHDNAERFEETLAEDLGRPPVESVFLELGGTIGEILTAYNNVEEWAKPERPSFNLQFAPMRRVIRKEPKGIVLVISPFNYPVYLALARVAGAIAAGNCVVVKPSELTVATSALMAELTPKYLDPDIIRIVNGGPAECSKLLEFPWDHILYTGGSRVGKIIATAAAKHLSPVSLELGGKSPVFIDPKCDLKTAARRILWGRFANAGQTCTAPDYVLVPKDFQDEFVDALRVQYQEFFPDSSPPSADGTFGRLVSSDAFSRIEGMIKGTKGTIVVGGDMHESKRYVAPTIVKDVKGDDSLMSSEIFGPVLPVLPVVDVDEAIAFVNSRDHPLALYVFSKDDAYKKKVFNNTTSGAAVANETIIHGGTDGLPFGGIGPSGNGYCTGKYTFDMFTHLRASMDSPSWVDVVMRMRYFPYTDKKKKAAWKLFPKLPPRPAGVYSPPGTRWTKYFLLALALATVGLLAKISVNRRVI